VVFNGLYTFNGFDHPFDILLQRGPGHFAGQNDFPVTDGKIDVVEDGQIGQHDDFMPHLRYKGSVIHPGGGGLHRKQCHQSRQRGDDREHFQSVHFCFSFPDDVSFVASGDAAQGGSVAWR